jgi:hypothetical protein
MHRSSRCVEPICISGKNCGYISKHKGEQAMIKTQKAIICLTQEECNGIEYDINTMEISLNKNILKMKEMPQTSQIKTARATPYPPPESSWFTPHTTTTSSCTKCLRASCGCQPPDPDHVAHLTNESPCAVCDTAPCTCKPVNAIPVDRGAYFYGYQNTPYPYTGYSSPATMPFTLAGVSSGSSCNTPV